MKSNERSIFKVLTKGDWLIIILLNIVVWPLGIIYNLYNGYDLSFMNFWGIMVVDFLVPFLMYTLRLISYPYRGGS